MRFRPISKNDIFGFLRPELDAHTMGILNVTELLLSCGISTFIGDSIIARAANFPESSENESLILSWLAKHRISRLGFSYRLDPSVGIELFHRFFNVLKQNNYLFADGGAINSLYFAGLPDTCRLISRDFGSLVIVFDGEDSQFETLNKLGVPKERIPSFLRESDAYDSFRLSFGDNLIKKELFRKVKAHSRPNYLEYGGKRDTLLKRLLFAREKGTLPLLRAHVGPFEPDRKSALLEFNAWLYKLAQDNLLDIASIGTSQLSQERFGENWNGLKDSGGVPLNSEKELLEAWEYSRPMLIRTYAGTKNIRALAEIFEKTINIAWHALSFWWFSKIDGRGPNSVWQNLHEHFSTLSYIASTKKPFEPNTPHHFAFRGSDDLSYIVSAYLTAKAAKSRGIKTLVLQTMLNNPRATIGIRDLAKVRTTLRLCRGLEDANFKIILQPRAGLDFFSPDPHKARAQLAAVTALMDDIEPENQQSPEIIHVVSFSEAYTLATPDIINESAMITRSALNEYRYLKNNHKGMGYLNKVAEIESELLADSKNIISHIENDIFKPYTPEGFYNIFAAGYLPVPHLLGERDEFKFAVNWTTKAMNGGSVLVNENGLPISVYERCEIARDNLKRLSF